MASTYRDYDKEIMSQADYEKLQGYKQDWKNATDEAGRKTAHDNAANLRTQYGYSMGDDGSQFSILDPRTGVSTDTGAQLLKYGNQANNPTGQSDFYKQWTKYINDYMNRSPFSYDLASDALYQQYADQYTRLGDQAMQETLGQAAALTGGYNSSYAQNAGQQAYQGYLDQLNDIVPELYGQAYDRYNQEGQDMLNAANLAAQGYSQETADYWNNLNFWNQQAANEQSQYWQQKDFDQSEYWQQKEYEQQQAEYAASQKQAAYSNLVTAISNTGYKPTDAELAAAGMTREEADRWANYYAMNLQVFSSGSGGSSGRSSGKGDSSNPSGSDATDTAMAAAADIAGNFSGYRTLDGAELSSKLSSYSSKDRAKIMAYLRKYHNFFYSWEYDINNVGHDVYNKD